MAKLGDTDLDVRGINLGGNVFGWTADEQRSFAVLDAYTAAGGNFIDTADVYSGGESETIIGNWLARRGRRDDVVIATKVGMWEQRKGLSAANIAAAAEDSLRRLQVDHIDLYYAHFAIRTLRSKRRCRPSTRWFGPGRSATSRRRTTPPND